jgi:hypothetical protein
MPNTRDPSSFDADDSEANPFSGPESNPFGDNRVKIEFLVDRENPNLLAGLEELVNLGILTHRQVLLLAKRSLTSPYTPTPVAIVNQALEPAPLEPVPVVAASIPTNAAAPTPRTRQSRPQAAPTTPTTPNVITALMAEISVAWLLFLGVFLVVVSSAALAAIQWRSFPAVGQYGILWLYTLAFGGAGLWAGQRDNLKLTGRMLKIAALLIIPVNFWMMDGFALWASGSGWIMMAIAAASLLALQTRLLQGASAQSRWNSFLLNGLQWGWSITFVPLLFTYVGTTVTAFVQAIAQRSRNTTEANDSEASDAEASDREPLSGITIAFATLLLVGRAILIQGIPLSRFGLAIAMIGGLIYWLNRDTRQQQQVLGAQAGAALLGLGWVVSYLPDSDWIRAGIDPLGIDPMWQTLAISALAIGLLFHRLHQRWETATAAGLWAFGLQTYTIARVIIPSDARRKVMIWVTDWANLQVGAWELTGLGLFGYLLIALGFASYLRRRNQWQLADVVERLTAVLGVGLALISLLNPLVRAIYFTLSAILLVALWLRRRSGNVSVEYRGNLVYLLHASSAIAVVSWILWLFPKLLIQQWVWILVLGAVVEWGFAALSRDRFWQNSAWLLGLAQATCAYPLLLSKLPFSMREPYAGLPWLLVPIALTSLAYAPRFSYSQIAIGLSVLSSGLSLLLMLTSVNAALITLAVVTVVMFANSVWARQLYLAALTMGFGLAYALLQAWQLFRRPEPQWYLVGLAIAVWLVWLLRDWLDRGTDAYAAADDDLSYLYVVAANGWGRGLGILMGVLLGAIVMIAPGLPSSMNYIWDELLLAGGLTYGAIIYRVWQSPTDLGLWGLAIGAETLVNLVAEYINAPLNYRVVVTLLFAIGTLLIGDYWQRQNANRPTWTAFNGVPGAFAALGLILAHGVFNQLTGVYTIAASVIFILLSRRRDRLTALSYLGLLGISVGAYEWVLYILSRSSGGRFGDGVTILAAVAAGLALLYQALKSPIGRFMGIAGKSLIVVSFGHWCFGSLLSLAAALAGWSVKGVWIWLGVQLLLVITVLWQGRSQHALIYFGFAQMVGAIAVLLNQLLPVDFLPQWGSVFASIFGFGILCMNWERWGWSRQPWHRSATALPGTIALITAAYVNPITLLLTAAFYGSYAWKTGQIRLSYPGVLLAIWGLFRWLGDLNVADPFWYAVILCLAILFVVEVDPALQTNSARSNRHLIRCFALGIFCVTLFYDPWKVAWQRGLFAIVIAFGLAILGLVRRTRAYLYVGTVTFILSVLRILWLYVSEYSLLLWAVGIAIGLALIWVAATFEARRSQAIAIVEYWLQELADWE